MSELTNLLLLLLLLLLLNAGCKKYGLEIEKTMNLSCVEMKYTDFLPDTVKVVCLLKCVQLPACAGVWTEVIGQRELCYLLSVFDLAALVTTRMTAGCLTARNCGEMNYRDLVYSKPRV